MGIIYLMTILILCVGVPIFFFIGFTRELRGSLQRSIDLQHFINCSDIYKFKVEIEKMQERDSYLAENLQDLITVYKKNISLAELEIVEIEDEEKESVSKTVMSIMNQGTYEEKELIKLYIREQVILKLYKEISTANFVTLLKVYRLVNSSVTKVINENLANDTKDMRNNKSYNAELDLCY